MHARAIWLAVLLSTVSMAVSTQAGAQGPAPAASAPAAPPQGPPPADAGALAAPGPLTYTQALTPEAIRRVQDRLRAIGIYGGASDGSWGPDSQSALQRYQQGSGLQVTGQLNQATAVTLGLTPADLISGSSVPAPAPPPPAPAAAPPPAQPAAPSDAPHAPFALSIDSVRIVQSRLRQLGFYDGYVDGVWGLGTQSAMQRFQSARGLPVTGGLNAPTVTAMGIDPSSMTAR